MMNQLKIGSIVFGGGISTLGMDVIKGELGYNYPKGIEFKEFRPDKLAGIKDMDVIMVSLYWFDNLMDYMKFLKDAGINPKRKKPILVIGGIAAINTHILKDHFHYCVLGDGELCIVDLVRCFMDGSDPSTLPGVVANGDFESPKQMLTNPVIPARSYIEVRDRRSARIEIARGCRFKCPFCQLAHCKPYREQPVEVVEHLMKQTGTKSIGLFAPDRTGYSEYERLEEKIQKWGKNNTAEDARLDMLMKYKVVSKLKFGVEGFSERSRKEFRKVVSNDALIAGFRHIFEVLKTPKGKPLTTATVYMIADLPNEDEQDVKEFWGVLQEIDKFAPGKFTMFLTLNSFSPKPFTPYERKGINLYQPWNKWWNDRPKYANMIIACRGGLLGPANRIIHLMTARGDERLTKALMYFATDGRKIFKHRSMEAGHAVEKILRKSGVDPESIWGELDDDAWMPHNQFTIQPLPSRKKK